MAFRTEDASWQDRSVKWLAFAVIASEAKRSILATRKSGLFRRYAPRDDGRIEREESCPCI